MFGAYRAIEESLSGGITNQRASFGISFSYLTFEGLEYRWLEKEYWQHISISSEMYFMIFTVQLGNPVLRKLVANLSTTVK